MSKRTIIIGVVAMLAIIAALLSMYFEYKSTIDEANRIINGETEPEPKPKPTKVKAVKVENIEPLRTEENGTITE
jgi:uncharacterized protein YxeA